MGAVRTQGGFTTTGDNNSVGPISLVGWYGATGNVLWNSARAPYGAYYANMNGNLTFNAAFATATTSPLVGFSFSAAPILAPFWADIDTSGGGSMKYVTSPGIVYFQSASGLDSYTMGGAWMVTWTDVPRAGGDPSLTNKFQVCLFIRRDTGPTGVATYSNWDVEFNYDRVQWDTGARVGFSDGTSTAPENQYEFPGSGVPGAFVDGGPNALVSSSHNSVVRGRYLFRMRDGLFVDPFGRFPNNTEDCSCGAV